MSPRLFPESVQGTSWGYGGVNVITGHMCIVSVDGSVFPFCFINSVGQIAVVSPGIIYCKFILVDIPVESQLLFQRRWDLHTPAKQPPAQGCHSMPCIRLRENGSRDDFGGKSKFRYTGGTNTLEDVARRCSLNTMVSRTDSRKV